MKRSKQTTDSERAVSPVIGVILMVAITVILAAVVAAFVLDLGDTSANAQANFEISQDEDDLEVTIRNADRLDEVRVTSDHNDCEFELSDDSNGMDMDMAVGSTGEETITDLGDSPSCENADQELQFILEYNGEETLGPDFDFEEHVP